MLFDTMPSSREEIWSSLDVTVDICPSSCCSLISQCVRLTSSTYLPESRISAARSHP